MRRVQGEQGGAGQGVVSTLTMARIAEAMALVNSMPPVPFLASCATLASDFGVRFTVEGREYVGCHPDMWAKVPRGTSINPMAEVPVWDIDAEANAAKRHEFFDAMGKAMGVLPAFENSCGCRGMVHTCATIS